MNEKLFPLPKDFDTEQYPYTAKYIMLYGAHNCMSKFDLKAPYNSCEDVYKECLKRGVSWEKLLNFKGYKKGIML